MKSQDLYEIVASSIDDASHALASRLSLSLVPRDSSFFGEYSSGSGVGAEVFMVRKNEDPIDHEPAEMKFPDAAFLLYIDGTVRSIELEKLLVDGTGKFRLLRNEEGSH